MILRTLPRLLGYSLLYGSIFLTALPVLAKTTPSAVRSSSTEHVRKDRSFQSFVAELWPLAHAKGISQATFKAAFAGLEPDPSVVALTHRQSEFVKPIWTYIDTAVSPERIARGRLMAQQWEKNLDAIERTYGVDRAVVLGVWGMETNYGAFTGGKLVIRSLATLAFERYRGTFFRDELLIAIRLLQSDHLHLEDMKGSWAGAMGQTQFMPSSFIKYAVDGNGDGVRDIWTNVPDALASTANYLHKHGWRRGEAWGYAVRLPAHFTYAHDHDSFGGWAKRGVVRVDGKALPQGAEAALFLPAGAGGPAFLTTSNFTAIKTYNSSDAYALGVAHLGDRIYSGEALEGWPREETSLTPERRKEVQKQLATMGYAVGPIDGNFGSKTRLAVRSVQIKNGLIPDGYADLNFWRFLQKKETPRLKH